MSTKIIRSLPRARTLYAFKPSQRTFITLPGTERQSLSTTRIMPYDSPSLYPIIADVDSYQTFLPFCLHSRVTQWSEPDSNNQRHPAFAYLTVGWGGYRETFASRLFCISNSTVEALGGDAETTLPKSALTHYNWTLQYPAKENNVFQSITTRWTLKPIHYKPPSGQPQTDKAVLPARDQTEVHLSMDFQFSNPVYAALTKAVAPKIAGVMIEAFEVRARTLLDGPGATVEDDELRNAAGRKKAEAS